MRPATKVQSDPAETLGFQAARRMCRDWEDFTFAARFLDRSKRDAVCAVVAFFGMIGDAIGREHVELGGAGGLRQHPAVVSPAGAGEPGGAGGCCSSGGSEALLATFRGRLDQIFDGRLELPALGSRSLQQHALHAFARTVERVDVSRDHFVRFAQERARDATIERYATWARLEHHCSAIGGSVAGAVAETLGMQHSEAPRAVDRLGTGLGLVEVLRNVQINTERDRVYLPQEDLARCRYSERELLEGVKNDRLDVLWTFEGDRARSLLAEGSGAIGWIAGDKSRLFAATLVSLAQATLRRPPLRPQLTTAMRLRQIPAAWRLARRGPVMA